MPALRYQTIATIVFVFVAAAVIVRLLHAVIHRALGALDIVGAENREAVHARAKQLIGALTMLAYGGAALAVISLALNRFGVNEPRWDPRLFVHWVLTHGVNLVVIIVGAFIVVHAANLSKHFAYAVVDVRVAYSENIDRVIGTIREVGAAMQRDAVFGALILAPIEVLGVESLADGAVLIRTKFKTPPLNQGKVANELRRRLLAVFVARGIKPYA